VPTHSTWQLQEAKAKLSELVRRARTEGPQTITVHGERAVVVTAAGDIPEETAPLSIVDVLLNAPKLFTDEEIDALFGRSPDVGRDVVFDD
jgi:prevent-host-death family protein